MKSKSNYVVMKGIMLPEQFEKFEKQILDLKIGADLIYFGGEVLVAIPQEFADKIISGSENENCFSRWEMEIK